MKKLFVLMLAFAVALLVCACGSEEPEGPPEPTQWVISTEFITQRVQEFAASEELKFLQDVYRETVYEFHGTDKVYGPYLTGAAEVYALYDNGEGEHFLVMGISGDMKVAIDAYFDYVTVVYDLGSGLFYDSLSQNRAELKDHYAALDRESAIFISLNGGSDYRGVLENLPRTFGSFPTKPGYIFTRELSADEVTSINTALELEPIPPRGINARPELNTTPEERKEIIVGAVKQFVESEMYNMCYPNGDIPTVQAATEFAIQSDLQNHSLIIQLDNVVAEFHREGKIVVDMDTGIVYTDAEFNDDWVDLDTPEKVSYLLASVYDRILKGEEEFFWSNVLESTVKLTDKEIKAINKELKKYFEKNPIPQPTEPIIAPDENMEQQGGGVAAAELDVQFVIDTLREIQKSKEYQDHADDPSVIKLMEACTYYVQDIEGFEVNVAMLSLDHIDTKRYGITADVFLVELSTGKVYSNFNLDMNNWGAFQSVEDAYAMILSSYYWEDSCEQIWTENEQIMPLSEKDISAINKKLK